MLETQIIILIILLSLSGFFSGIETALMSISQIKVKALVKEGKKGAIALQRIKDNPQRLIITILIGNNLVNIGAASLATLVFTDIFGSTGVGVATGVMSAFCIIPIICLLICAISMKWFKLDGPEWKKKKKELQEIHIKKEKEYVEYLKNEGLFTKERNN